MSLQPIPFRPMRHSRSLSRQSLFPAKALCASCAVVLSTLVLAAGSAHAEEASAENKAAARDLATSGIQLAQEGKCDQAIPKLIRAEELYHAPTILTWVGQCQIQVGRLVEGTETLNRVVRENIGADAPAAYLDAQKRAQDLIDETKPKIGKLTIEIEPSDVSDVEVSINDRPLASALVGAPRPTDPGKQVVTVSAPGYKTATQEILVAEGGRETLTFSLEIDPNAATGTGSSASDTHSPSEDAKSNAWIGWTVVGVGGAFLAAGGVTGIMAMSKEKDLAKACPDPKSCDASNDSTYSAAKTNATLSTVFFGVGGAAVVTGVVLVLTGGSKKQETGGRRLTPLVGLGSIGVSGSF